MAYRPGDVVVVPFPFRDQPGWRKRPSVVVSNSVHNQRGDVICAAITSRDPRNPSDYALLDWQAAGLNVPSTVRMLLTTLADLLVFKYLGRLTDRDWVEVRKRVIQVFS